MGTVGRRTGAWGCPNNNDDDSKDSMECRRFVIGDNGCCNSAAASASGRYGKHNQNSDPCSPDGCWQMKEQNSD